MKTTVLALALLLMAGGHAAAQGRHKITCQAPPLKAKITRQAALAAPAMSAGGHCRCIDLGKQCDCTRENSCGCTTITPPKDAYATGEKKRATDGGPDWTWDYYRGVYCREMPAQPMPLMTFQPAFQAPMASFGGFGGAFGGGACGGGG